MSLRAYFEQNSRVGFTVVGVIFILAAIMVARGLRSPDLFGSTKWMYDLNSRTLVNASTSNVAPADLGGGTFSYREMSDSGSAVDAFVFTCEDPTAVQEGMSVDDLHGIGAKLGFLARYSDQDADALRSPNGRGGGDPGRLLSEVDKLDWVPENSEPGMALQNKARFVCPDGSISVLTRPI